MDLTVFLPLGDVGQPALCRRVLLSLRHECGLVGLLVFLWVHI